VGASSVMILVPTMRIYIVCLFIYLFIYSYKKLKFLVERIEN